MTDGGTDLHTEGKTGIILEWLAPLKIVSKFAFYAVFDCGLLLWLVCYWSLAGPVWTDLIDLRSDSFFVVTRPLLAPTTQVQTEFS